MITIRINSQNPQSFVDFLVGHGQPAFSVSIQTSNPAAQVAWTITPLGNPSGTVSPNQGAAKQFQFSPQVASARAGLTTGSTSPNQAVGYRISVTATNPPLPGSSTPQTEQAQAEFRQDEISILRQEYVDFGGTPPARSSVTQHTGAYNVGNYSYVANLQDMQTRFNSIQSSYRGSSVTVGAQAVTIPASAGISISSAYRNPRRNVHAGSTLGLGSRHVTGHALDLVPNTPVVGQATGPRGPVSVPLELHAHLYHALQAAANTQGTAIAERGATQVPVGSLSEDHIHVGW